MRGPGHLQPPAFVHNRATDSWVTESELAPGAEWILNAFWANISSGLSDKDFEEGDMVYASDEWIRAPRFRVRRVIADHCAR